MLLNKKNIFWSTTLALAIVSCSKDNYDQPNASLEGVLIDATTAAPVPGVVRNGNFGDLQFFQLDYGVINPTAFSTAGFKADGTYANATLFNGNYKLVPRGPFFYTDTVVVDLKGKMKIDLPVVPYTYVNLTVAEVMTNSITVKIKASRNATAEALLKQQVSAVVALLGTTAGVNYNNYYVVQNNTTEYRYVVNTSAIPNDQIAQNEYTYTFKNLKPGTTYYLRGASRVSTNNPSGYYNYSGLFVVKTNN